MAYTEVEQRRMIVGEVLELHRDFNALVGLLRDADDPENRVTVEIYNDLLWFMHRLLWHDMVLRVCWMFEKKGQRSVYWYLNSIRNTNPNDPVDRSISKLDSVQNEVKEIRKFRDKWVAHRDRNPYEESDAFWNNRPNIEKMSVLVNMLEEIIQTHFPIVDTTSTGLERLFAVIKVLKREDPNFLYTMRKYGFLRK